MNDLAHTQELARLFNKVDAIQHEFDRRQTRAISLHLP